MDAVINGNRWNHGIAVMVHDFQFDDSSGAACSLRIKKLAGTARPTPELAKFRAAAVKPR